jgi:photosystem II stability/assembly factor-like uncharacterized protein
MIEDPASRAASERRWTLIGVAVVALALVALVAAGVVIVSIDHGRGPRAIVSSLPATSPSALGGRAVPELADGSVVPAAELYSDPVFVDSETGFALATTDPGGVPSERLVRSDDAGAIWQVIGTPFPVAGDFSTLIFETVQVGYVYGPAGLLVTFDGGRSWRQAPIDGELERVIPIASNVWATYASCPGVPSPTESCTVGLAISTNGGRSWSRVPGAPPLSESEGGGEVLARVSLDKAYLLSYGPTAGGLAVTSDAGATWSALADPCVSGWSSEALAAPGNGQLWLICGGPPSGDGQAKSVYRSVDGGREWSLTASTGFVAGQGAPVGSIPLAGFVSQLATVSASVAWLGLGGLGLVQTTDGGRIWKVVPGIDDAGGSADVGVTFIATGNDQIVDGWALGFGYAVWHTTNATDWHLVSGP